MKTGRSVCVQAHGRVHTCPGKRTEPGGRRYVVTCVTSGGAGSPPSERGPGPASGPGDAVSLSQFRRPCTCASLARTPPPHYGTSSRAGGLHRSPGERGEGLPTAMSSALAPGQPRVRLSAPSWNGATCTGVSWTLLRTTLSKDTWWDGQVLTGTFWQRDWHLVGGAVLRASPWGLPSTQRHGNEGANAAWTPWRPPGDRRRWCALRGASVQAELQQHFSAGSVRVSAPQAGSTPATRLGTQPCTARPSLGHAPCRCPAQLGAEPRDTCPRDVSASSREGSAPPAVPGPDPPGHPPWRRPLPTGSPEAGSGVPADGSGCPVLPGRHVSASAARGRAGRLGALSWALRSPRLSFRCSRPGADKHRTRGPCPVPGGGTAQKIPPRSGLRVPSRVSGRKLLWTSSSGAWAGAASQAFGAQGPAMSSGELSSAPRPTSPPRGTRSQLNWSPGVGGACP